MFRIARSLDDLLKAYIVRAIVFIDEQRTPYAIEMDPHEHSAVHIIGEAEGEPFAAGRIRFLGEYAKLERLAVRRQWRGRGYGDRLLAFMIRTARDHGFEKFKVHAQLYAQGFYEKHGFTAVGETFMEAEIEHCLMLKDSEPFSNPQGKAHDDSLETH